MLLCGASFLAVFGCCLFSTFNSARRPNEAIEDELLRATPLGSDEAAVDRYAKEHFAQDNFFEWRNSEAGRILSARYGCYQTLENFPFATCVEVTWSFDKDKKLTRISVGKWVDLP
jgi:hypothetical protein